MRVFFLLLLSSLLILGSTADANERAKKEKQLTQLKSKIDKLRKTIEVKENSKSSYTRQLRKIEKKIGSLSQKIRNTNQAVRQQQKQLSRLKKQKRKISQQLKRQNELLSRQLYTAYTLGQQEQMKLLFSQGDANNLQRNLTYYQYFSSFRAQQIEGFNQNYQQLSSKEQEIILAKQKLEAVLRKQQQQKASLSQDRLQREKILATLEKELKKQGRHLNRLEENARNLRQLIDSISQILVENPARKKIKNFSRLKGKLSWPVKGRVKKMFGRRKPPSDLRWQGVVIDAPRGNNVRAIAHGRVAFADWLRGMGNLIIIDHGNGYLSLYGHNESLFKGAGEWVEAGDIIASIGNSGGVNKAGLYFEIRRKGKPQNPTRWCKAGNWFKQI
jgi:septal ring factor EnvC (AmiA/AmiB activator)